MAWLHGSGPETPTRLQSEVSQGLHHLKVDGAGASSSKVAARRGGKIVLTVGWDLRPHNMVGEF